MPAKRPKVTNAEMLFGQEMAIVLLLKELKPTRLEALRTNQIKVLAMSPMDRSKAAGLDYLDYLLSRAQALQVKKKD